MARADVVRCSVYLPRSLSQRLEVLVRGQGRSRSKIIVEAVAAFFDSRGDDALELRFMARLNRLSNQLARIERNGQVELESLALFIRYMLTVNAPLPDDDKAAQAIGRDRFQAFIERVGRSLAGGRLTLLGEDDQ